MAKRYAMIGDKNLVVYIGNETEKNNSEPSTEWIELTDEEVAVVKIGYLFRRDKGVFERVRQPIKEEQKRLLEKNVDIYSQKMGALLSGYDYYEIMTFPYQTQDLLNYRKMERGEYGELWFLPALCAARGIPLDMLIPKLEDKIRLFSKASGYVTGMKQRFEDRIPYAENYDLIDELDKHLDMWRNTPLE